MYTKVYTLTWKRPNTWRKNGVCRCRFDAASYYWIASGGVSVIHAFKVLLSLGNFPFGDCNFRLSSCGRLVARSATYQGV